MLHPKIPPGDRAPARRGRGRARSSALLSEHRRRLHSTNPLERLHKEIKRRTRVVGIVPTRDSLMRLVGALLAEQDDEWQVADRRYFSVGSMTKVDALEGGEDPRELLAQIA
jgi:putative transposase